MSDTTVQECRICHNEDDCVNGVCSNCDAEIQAEVKERCKTCPEYRNKYLALAAENEKLRKAVGERKELLNFCVRLEKTLKRDCYVSFDGPPKELKTLLDKICGPEKHKLATAPSLDSACNKGGEENASL